MEELSSKDVDRRTDALLAEAEAYFYGRGCQDLADVLRLIQAAELPRSFGAEIDPYVRAKFDELWLASQHSEEDY